MRDVLKEIYVDLCEECLKALEKDYLAEYIKKEEEKTEQEVEEE